MVTVAGVGMMQVAVDEVVDMVAVRHCLVPAARPMHVVRRVRAAVVLGRAVTGIRAVDGNRVFVYVVAMRVMEMTIVDVVNVTVMDDGGVSAVGAVSVIVVFVLVACHGRLSPCRCGGESSWADSYQFGEG